MKRTFAAFVVLGVIAATFFAASPAYAAYPGHNGRIAFQADIGGGQLAVHLPGLAPRRVAEDEPVVQAHHLAVDVQHKLPGLVGDIGVLTETEHTLANDVHLLHLLFWRILLRQQCGAQRER